MYALTRDDVRRVSRDLLIGELCRSRNISSIDLDWQAEDGELWLNERGLNLSSIERVELASAASELFHLFDSPLGDRLLITQTLDEWAKLVTQYAGQSAVTFRTSGSTGAPTSQTHSYQHLLDEVDGYTDLLRDSTRIVSLVPAHHIYGFLWTVLLPNTLNKPALSFSKSREVLHTGLQSNDVIVATPLWWEYISRARVKLPPGCVGVCSTGALGEDLRRSLLPLMSNFIEIYGSSETGGIGIRTNTSDAYELLPRWQAISTSGEQLLRAGSGDVVPLPDHIECTGERCFRVSGRRDQLVQVAGHNVSPQKISKMLLQCAGIEEVSVRMMRPDEGQALKALVVTEQADDRDARNVIRKQVAQMLPAHERPQLTFKTEMPRNALGKLADW
ncbi:MAG: AMP-binding protein [Pseudomonadales bacterium]